MRRSLSEQDIHIMKNQCSMGYFISFALFVLGTVAGITIYESYVEINPNRIDYQMDIIIGIGVLIFSMLILLGINWKYFADIRNNEKIQIIKILQDKNYTTEYYRSFVTGKYNFVVENITFEVEKQLYETCSEKDKLIFYYAPKSKFLLGIEKA